MADAYSYLTGTTGDAYARLSGSSGTTWARLPGTVGDAWERLVASVGPLPVVGDTLLIFISQTIWRTRASGGLCYCTLQEHEEITTVSPSC